VLKVIPGRLVDEMLFGGGSPSAKTPPAPELPKPSVQPVPEVEQPKPLPKDIEPRAPLPETRGPVHEAFASPTGAERDRARKIMETEDGPRIPFLEAYLNSANDVSSQY
jgi:hypothetical protein